MTEVWCILKLVHCPFIAVPLGHTLFSKVCLLHRVNFVMAVDLTVVSVEATFDFVKKLNFTINSFDIVAVVDNKVECCFDKVERCFGIVAGVDGA